MSVFKKFKLGTKIAVGFGSLVVILFLNIMFGYLGLSNISKDFSHYRKIAKNDVLAGKIQANLFNSQIHFKNFIVSGDSSEQKQFEEEFKKMEDLINQAKNNMVDVERQNKINQILDYAVEYQKGFSEIKDYQDKRNALVLDILTNKGTEIEENLAELIELAYGERNESLLYNIGKIQRHFLLARLHVGKYLEDNKDDFTSRVTEEGFEMDIVLKNLNNERTNAEERKLIDLIENDKKTYINGFEELVSIIKSRNEIISSLNDIGLRISSTAEEIKLSIVEEQNTFEPKVRRNNDRSLYKMGMLSIVAIILSVLISIGVIKTVIVPVRTVTDTFKGISEGEADLKIRLKGDSADEIGEMANYFNRFMEKLQDIMDESEKQNWLKTGQSELNERISGEQNIKRLAYNIITYVSKYLGAQVGAFYLKTDEDTYKMLSSYAYKKRKNLSNEIKTGEGLVGQCALEKQTITISNIPKDYITINSGLGEAVPNNILVTPCTYHEDVKCIIELGSFNEFSDTQIEFIEIISHIIAVSINSVESRTQMKELLDKSLKQTEELQLQQEELKQANEELEQQTIALKESETRLQEQQEELRVINEELEEQTEDLKNQRDEINKKNEALQMVQEEIKEKAVDLELANKYKSEFLANMSHELRTPLNSILILSKLLSDKQENTTITTKDLEFAETIYSSGFDLLNLINDILDLSKVEAGKMEVNPENMNLRELIYDIERSFKEVASQKALKLNVDISADAPDSIYTDPQRVKQIVNNLISNAFKFTERGGVTVNITRPKENEIKGEIDYRRAIKIAVTDTGIGIPKDKQRLIFEAFKQSDGTISRKYGGTGLGLSISKEFTKLLGGEITLDSSEGRGTTFSLILPERLPLGLEVNSKADYEKRINQDVNSLTITEVAATKSKEIENINEETEETKNLHSLNERCILIIEDDPQFSRILGQLASEKGFKCLETGRGEQGVKLAIENRPIAIILDIGLPDIDGWEVVKRLKSNSITKNIPVHVISGYENSNGDEIKKGIVGYLKKPISLEEVNEIFANTNKENGQEFKNILIVEDNKNQRFSISELMNSQGARTTAVDSGKEAYNILKSQSFDCLILDLGLVDMSGFELLEMMDKDNLLEIPVIIYTGKELSIDEEAQLKKYAKTIIIKGPRSMERLTSEVSLFLHSIASKITEKKDEIENKDCEKQLDLRDKKILIVDDDMRNVFALTSILEKKDIKVIVGKNGKEGIEKLIKNPDTDLILMDIMMPEMDGYTAMSEIRNMEEYGEIPIIALTAKAMREDKNKCIEAGANDYLAKPVDIDKLISLLKVWLYK
ncbi:response regulator [Wukongibacter sp. M2B1]|uniref:response regulator n=1 Tax=Wukongibacter sp. M2B1 TaxID=3088895 RepID=UPI003D7906D9